MSVLNATEGMSPSGGYPNPCVSALLSQMDFTGWPPSTTDSGLLGASALTYARSPALAQALDATNGLSYFDDFYNRIHVTPSTIDLGNISAAQQRQANVWNAFPDPRTLTQILTQNADGIDITPPGAYPITFKGLQEKQFGLAVTMRGPASIRAALLYDFADVDRQPTLLILGSRALTLQSVPDVPLTETWSWLTDIIPAVDGSEQRIAVRRVPRFSEQVTLTADNDVMVRDQYQKIMSASGRLFLPWLQTYALTQASAAIGATSLLFDTQRADVRKDEYVMLLPADGSAAVLAQVDTVSASGVALKTALSGAIGKGAAVAPAFGCIVSDNSNLSIQRAGGFSSLTLSVVLTAPRAQFQRPGAIATLVTYDGLPVLERVSDQSDDAFTTGQQVFDSGIGILDVVTEWIFTQVAKPLKFACQRIFEPADMDYWRLFLDTVQGRRAPFLWSTDQRDQELVGSIGLGASTMTLATDAFASLYFPIECFKRLKIVTDGGAAYVTATSAQKDANGNTSVQFAPALPATVGWDKVQRISFLLKLRLDSDDVTLEHDVTQTTISFPVRTVQA